MTTKPRTYWSPALGRQVTVPDQTFWVCWICGMEIDGTEDEANEYHASHVLAYDEGHLPSWWTE